MLSKAAFNSMLKTLEEPPEHVKFVLATTDPQKIPVTVLSRCLQFNLKLLPAQLIAARLGEILRAESIAFDETAVALIARVAHGSMRDALSVLDQAIAYGAGEVREAAVRAMLGAVDPDYCYRIADALLAADGPALLEEARALAERSVSMPSALDELAGLFHRIAVAQAVPAAADALPDAARIAAYARSFTSEAVQLAYQICVQGREDLPLAPDEQTGFAMTLLRLLAFEPGDGGESKPADTARATSTASGAAARSTVASQSAAPEDATPRAAGATTPEITDWPAFVASMKLTGIALQLAGQTELKAISGNEFRLAVPEAARHLTDKPYADKLKAALEQALGKRVRISFEFGAEGGETLSAQEKRERSARQAKTEAAFRDDPFVQDVLSRFDARIKPDSIKPL
jgi:DNA polymerase III subunit gamma/tau